MAAILKRISTAVRLAQPLCYKRLVANLRVFVKNVLSLDASSWTVVTYRSSVAKYGSGTAYLYMSKAAFACDTPEGLFSGFLEYSAATGDVPQYGSVLERMEIDRQIRDYPPKATVWAYVGAVMVIDETFYPRFWFLGREYSLVAATVDDLAQRHGVATMAEFRERDQHVRRQGFEQRQQAKAADSAVRKKYGGA